MNTTTFIEGNTLTYVEAAEQSGTPVSFVRDMARRFVIFSMRDDREWRVSTAAPPFLRRLWADLGTVNQSWYLSRSGGAA